METRGTSISRESRGSQARGSRERRSRPTALSLQQTSGLTALSAPALTALILLLAILLPAAGFSQKKISLQVKTFDQSMKPVGNIEVALNDSGYFMIGSKGTAVIELNEADARITSVRVKDDAVEAATWNVSRGVVEIVIRPKSHRVLRFVLKLPDGKGVPGASITYVGSVTVESKTDPAGRFVLQLPLKERVRSGDQFKVKDLQVTGLTLSETESILSVVRPKVQVPTPIVKQPAIRVQADKPVASESVQKYVLDRATLDTISSLTSFYAMVRNVPMSNLTVMEKDIVDAKFNALLEENINSPLNEPVYENDTLQTRLGDFEEKAGGDQQQSTSWLVGIAVVIVVVAALVILLIILYSRLRERTLSLEQAKHKIEHDSESSEEVVARQTRLLSESNRELNLFIHRSAQELRSMLQSIIGLFKIIEDMPQRELVGRVEKATATMDRVLNKLIDISKIGQESSNVEQVKLIEVINNVKDLPTRSAPAGEAGRPLQFKVNCADDVTLHADRSLLEIVLNNLVENAIHFSTLKEASGPAVVEIAVVTRGDMLELSVYDNGVGMSKTAKSKVFNLSTDSPASAALPAGKQEEARGTGLYAVRKAVLAMHGKIDIMTEEGVFTRVVVMIPRGQPARKVAQTAKEERQSVEV